MKTSWAQARNGSILVGLILRVGYDAMHCCSQAQSQLGSLIIEHDNGYDDDDDDGQGVDHDIYHNHVHNY